MSLTEKQNSAALPETHQSTEAQDLVQGMPITIRVFKGADGLMSVQAIIPADKVRSLCVQMDGVRQSGLKPGDREPFLFCYVNTESGERLTQWYEHFESDMAARRLLQILWKHRENLLNPGNLLANERELIPA